VITFTGPPVVEVSVVEPKATFRMGQRIDLRMTETGELVRLTRVERVVAWFNRVWIRWTRWWRPRMVVAAMDADAGSITFAQEVWSWRRWRWEQPGYSRLTDAAQPSGVPPDVPPNRDT
jgi:hypothetical protein